MLRKTLNSSNGQHKKDLSLFHTDWGEIW